MYKVKRTNFNYCIIIQIIIINDNINLVSFNDGKIHKKKLNITTKKYIFRGKQTSRSIVTLPHSDKDILPTGFGKSNNSSFFFTFIVKITSISDKTTMTGEPTLFSDDLLLAI